MQRGLAAVVALAYWASAAAAGPFTDLVVFGDSLSDVGNISQATGGFSPGQNYWNGRFSNGPVYAETLATGLGLPPITRSTAGGNDFAYGGAQTSGTGGLYGFFIQDIDEQVTQFLGARTANDTTLYVVFAGANDLINGQTNVNVPVNRLSNEMGRLFSDGARKFLVFNLPPLGYTPRFNGNASTFNQYNAISHQFNTALATALTSFQTSNPAVTLYRFDVEALFTQALTNPAAFGLVNVTSPSQAVPDPNQYLFWDDLHPTATVHAILGQWALDLFRLPGDFNHDSVVDAADYILWRGGGSTAYIPYDFEIWRSHYGQLAGRGGGALAAVPEPATSVWGWLLFVDIMVLWPRGRRRREG